MFSLGNNWFLCQFPARIYFILIYYKKCNFLHSFRFYLQVRCSSSPYCLREWVCFLNACPSLITIPTPNFFFLVVCKKRKWKFSASCEKNSFCSKFSFFHTNFHDFFMSNNCQFLWFLFLVNGVLRKRLLYEI